MAGGRGVNREKKTAPTAIEKHAIAPLAALPAISSEGRHFQLHSGQFPSEGNRNEALRSTCVTVLSDEISSVSRKGRPLMGQEIRPLYGRLRLASSPEYRLCGRSLRTAMASAFFCPISTTNFCPAQELFLLDTP